MGASIIEQIRELEQMLGFDAMQLSGVNHFKYLEWLEDCLLEESSWLALMRVERELGRYE